MLEQKPLRILEIGEFCLFKRNRPRETTFVFTGDNPRHLADVEYTPFGPADVATHVAIAEERRLGHRLLFSAPSTTSGFPSRIRRASGGSDPSALPFSYSGHLHGGLALSHSSCRARLQRSRPPCLDRRSSFSIGRLLISSASYPWIQPRHCMTWCPDIGRTSVLSPRVFFGATSTSSGRFLLAPRKIPFIWRWRRGRKNRLIYSSPGRQTIQ